MNRQMYLQVCSYLLYPVYNLHLYPPLPSQINTQPCKNNVPVIQTQLQDKSLMPYPLIEVVLCCG